MPKRPIFLAVFWPADGQLSKKRHFWTASAWRSELRMVAKVTKTGRPWTLAYSPPGPKTAYFELKTEGTAASKAIFLAIFLPTDFFRTRRSSRVLPSVLAANGHQPRARVAHRAGQNAVGIPLRETLAAR